MQHVIQAVYNYASNTREQYLLLQLFRTALRKEIFNKIHAAKEFVVGNPTVVKLVINHFRGANASNYMAEAFGSLVTSLLALETLDLNTDPVDVYVAKFMCLFAFQFSPRFL